MTRLHEGAKLYEEAISVPMQNSLPGHSLTPLSLSDWLNDLTLQKKKSTMRDCWPGQKGVIELRHKARRDTEPEGHQQDHHQKHEHLHVVNDHAQKRLQHSLVGGVVASCNERGHCN